MKKMSFYFFILFSIFLISSCNKNATTAFSPDDYNLNFSFYSNYYENIYTEMKSVYTKDENFEVAFPYLRYSYELTQSIKNCFDKAYYNEENDHWVSNFITDVNRDGETEEIKFTFTRDNNLIKFNGNYENYSYEGEYNIKLDNSYYYTQYIKKSVSMDGVNILIKFCFKEDLLSFEPKNNLVVTEAGYSQLRFEYYSGEFLDTSSPSLIYNSPPEDWQSWSIKWTGGYPTDYALYMAYPKSGEEIIINGDKQINNKMIYSK